MISEAKPNPSGDSNGGQGEILADPHRSRSDMRLVRRSIRGGWNVPRSTRRRAVNKLDEYLDSEDPGLVIDTVKALAVLDNADLKTEAIAAQREKANANASSNNVFIHTGGNAAVVVQQALNDPEYIEFRRQRALRCDAEPGPIRPHGEPGAMENGRASSALGPGTNGRH